MAYNVPFYYLAVVVFDCALEELEVSLVDYCFLFDRRYRLVVHGR
jgi:hypothetical protein